MIYAQRTHRPTRDAEAWESNLQTWSGRQKQIRLTIACALCASLPAYACWDDAAARYQVNSTLLRAIARTESALDPQAISRNRNGSRDIGLMQINSSWLPVLTSHGIAERDLFDPCTNIYVGAWILAQNFQRLGSSCDAVGAYNARMPALRRAYAWKVYRNVQAIADKGRKESPTPYVHQSEAFAIP